MREDAKEKYRQLFATDKEKADAFDMIAERFYYSNFATMSKADYETLLFSLYLDQILKNSEADYDAYSDYTLSKALGISQSKISTLKVRKELQYPYSGFDWKESFKRVSERAVFENGKIKLFIPDKNLYLEIKNAIETSGGFIEIQLTPNLLQIRPEYFIDLVIAISNTEDRDKIRKEIKKQVKEKDIDISFMNQKPFGDQMKELAPEIIADIIDSIPGIGPIAGVLFKNIARAIINKV